MSKGIQYLLSIYMKEEARQEYSIVPRQVTYEARVIARTSHHTIR